MSPEALVDWFTRPGPDRPGVLNLSYNALDRHVIRGRADLPALLHPFAPVGARTSYSYAELLEQAGLLAGGLRQLGVRPGLDVALALPLAPELVVGLLACARLGAVAVPLPPDADPRAAAADDLGALLAVAPPVTLVDGPRKVALDAALEAAGRRATFAVVVRPEPETLNRRGDVDFGALMKPGQFEAGVCAELGADASFLRVRHGGTGAVVTHDQGWTVDLAAEASAAGLGPGSFVAPTSAGPYGPGTDDAPYAALLGPLLAGATVELR